jgi:hypothetical protein
MHLNSVLNLDSVMRYSSLLAACSGLALAATCLIPLQAATAAEIKGTRIASVGLEAPTAPTNQTKVVCSRNRPLSLSADGVKVASGIAPQSADWTPSIIKLFCRDVRINTIVVRDYCAIIRQ